MFRLFLPVSAVFRQGDEGNHFYCILKGSVLILVNDKPIKTLTECEGFGDIGLHSDQRLRTASVQCVEDSVMLVLTKEDYKRVIPDKSIPEGEAKATTKASVRKVRMHADHLCFFCLPSREVPFLLVSLSRIFHAT